MAAEAKGRAASAGGAGAAWKTALFWALRLGLGGLLLWAGVAKIGDPGAFAAEIGNYHLLPALAPTMAVTLPAVEIVLGLALVAGTRPWVRAAALGATLVLGVFTVAVISVVARGIDIECGCFGTGSSRVTMITVLRDVVLVAAAVGVYVLAGKTERAAPGPKAEPTEPVAGAPA